MLKHEIINNPKQKGTTVVFRGVKLDYPKLATPDLGYKSSSAKTRMDEPGYGTYILIPKSSITEQALRSLIESDGRTKFPTQKHFKYSLQDGDNQMTPDGPNPNPKVYRFDHWYLKLKSLWRPEVRSMNGLLSDGGDTEFYSGVIADVWAVFTAALNSHKNYQIFMRLLAVQKRADGARLVSEYASGLTDEHFEDLSVDNSFDSLEL